MTGVSRRALVAGLGASALRLPSIANATVQADFDVLIVGAGAAGISAARHILRSGKTVAILEGSDRLGGRCLTDTRTFSLPYDAGAQWIHETEALPLAQLCKEAGLEIHRAAPTTYLRIPSFQARQSTKYRPARDSELEHFYNVLVRCNRAIADAGGSGAELSCEKALPDD